MIYDYFVVFLLDKFFEVYDEVIFGNIIYGDGSIIINYGRKVIVLKVVNIGDRLV